MATQLPSSSSLPPSRGYDAYFSFRGIDTRNFADRLYETLLNKGINTFLDSVSLKRGELISRALFRAVQESRISIVILSENYASSGWCLDELVTILQCRESKQQMVWPVFYKVDMSHLRNQTSSFEFECRFTDKKKVLMWRRALRDVANLPGYHIQKGDSEATFISNIFEIFVQVLYGGQKKIRRSVSSWWQIGPSLGSGSFGNVYEAMTDDGFFFAVKEVSLPDQGSQEEDQRVIQLKKEISLLSVLEHENIVQYLGTHQDKTKLYISLELVSKGSLAKLYENYYLGDSQVSVFTRQILSGLKYLHDHKVVHRDIKCANILVDASGSVKLADFGLAKAIIFNTVNSPKKPKGTYRWMAPEVVQQSDLASGFAADIWSLGCTVLEMLTGLYPYPSLEWQTALFQIGMGTPPPVPAWLSRDAQDFISECLQAEPKSRPTAAQLLDHPFVNRPLHASRVTASPHCNSLRL